MNNFYSTIRVESELRNRLKREASKNLTYSEFIAQLLDFREKHQDHD